MGGQLRLCRENWRGFSRHCGGYRDPEKGMFAAKRRKRRKSRDDSVGAVAQPHPEPRSRRCESAASSSGNDVRRFTTAATGAAYGPKRIETVTNSVRLEPGNLP
jgi:hypothetical protein